MRAPLAALLAAATLPACNGLAGRPDRPTQRGYRVPPRDIPLGDVASGVELFAPRGTIRVVESARARLEHRLTVSANSAGEARAIAGRCEVSQRSGEGGRRVIGLEPPPDVAADVVGADSVLRVPPQLDLHLRTKSGLIDTAAYDAGEEQVVTQDGTIRTGRTSGRLRFRTRAGRIELAGSFADARGRSASGDLLVRNPTAGAKLDFRSTSGSCTLLVPPGVSLDIHYRTRTGELESHIPELERAESSNGGSKWTERRLRLTGARAGKPCDVFVETEAGNLVLRRIVRSEH